MNFYNLIQECKAARSQLEVRGQLMQHQFDDNIKELFRLMLDTSIIYNIKKALGKSLGKTTSIYHNDDLVKAIHALLKGDLRGHELKNQVQYICDDSTHELAEVFSWVLDRKNPAKVGKSLVNEVWPGLIRTQPYMGAVPGTDEALNKLPWSTSVNVQEKIDGMTLIVHYKDGSPVELRTRAGQDITKYFPTFLSRQIRVSGFNGFVHHEGLVMDHRTGNYRDRKTGNGLINKQVKNGTIGGDVDYSIHSYLLDMYDEDKPNRNQEHRYGMLGHFVHHNARRVEQHKMYHLQEGRKYAMHLIRSGMEGVICKDPNKPFKNGKPAFNVKIKNEFTVDLICIGYTPHSKIMDAVGSLIMTTSDGELQVNVGSGLTDFHRAVDPLAYEGLIIEVTAESISESKGKKKPSLYLPRFNTGDDMVLPIREDKLKADNFNEVKAQEKASKEMK